MFQSLRRYSIEFLSFCTILPHNALLDIPAIELINNITTCPSYLFSIISQFHNTTNQIHNFFSILIEEHLNALSTTAQEQADAPITLSELKKFMDLVSNFTDKSLHSVAGHASATLRDLARRAEDLEKELGKAKVRERVFDVVFSMLGIGFTAVLSPVASINVAPLVLSLNSLIEISMEKSIKEEQKVIENIRFRIHSAIVKVGRIKDIVEHLNMLVAKAEDVVDAKKRLKEMKKAVVEALAQVNMVKMEIEYPIPNGPNRPLIAWGLGWLF